MFKSCGLIGRKITGANETQRSDVFTTLLHITVAISVDDVSRRRGFAIRSDAGVSSRRYKSDSGNADGKQTGVGRLRQS